MARQLTFDLPSRTALGREDFFVSPANAEAVALIEAWADWPGGKLALTGPEGAGKSHLVQVWAAESGAAVLAAGDLAGADIPALAARGAVAVEDLEGLRPGEAGEVPLFHLHNLVLAEGGRLLLTGRTPPRDWPVGLPDLGSRLQATSVATLEPPDDALLAALLVKLFADRQLAVAPNVIAWLVPRIGRSFGAAQDVVNRLDRAALSEGRAVSRALAARVLDISTGDEA